MPRGDGPSTKLPSRPPGALGRLCAGLFGGLAFGVALGGWVTHLLAGAGEAGVTAGGMVMLLGWVAGTTLGFHAADAWRGWAWTLGSAAILLLALGAQG